MEMFFIWVFTRIVTSFTSKGFSMKSAAPSEKHLFFVSESESAVTKMMGISAVLGTALSISQNSKPSTPGMAISRSIRSGSFA